MTYSENFSALKEATGYDWLSSFSNSADSDLPPMIENWVDEAIPFEPFLVERHLSDVAGLVDDCLSWRNALQDLEAKAYERAIQFEYSKKSIDIDHQLATLSPSQSQLTSIQASQQDASTLFGDSNAAGAAWSRIYDGLAASGTEALEQLTSRNGLLGQKNAAAVAAHAKLESQHERDEGPLNFNQRAERLKYYLFRDLRLAILKARAVAVGVKHVYGIERDLPEFVGLAAIDQLAKWSSDVLERLEIQRGKEAVEFDFAISIGSPFAKPDNDPRTLLEDPSDLDAVKTVAGSGKLSFDLSPAFGPEYKKLRLRGVGLSCSWSNPTAADRNYLRLNAVIFPPPQRYLFSVDHATRRRPPIPITDVAQYPIVQYNRSDALWNSDPRGRWEIHIPSRFLYADATDRTNRSTDITDIKLHLLLDGAVKKDPDQWTKS